MGNPVAGQKRKDPPPSSAEQGLPTPSLARSNNSFIPAEKALRDAYEESMWNVIYAELGRPEPRPAKKGLNPFLLYQKDYWPQARIQADDNKRATSKNPNAKAARDEVRQVLGLMWRQAADGIKRPYLDQTETNRKLNQEEWERWQRDSAEYEKKTFEVRDRWCVENPFESWQPGSSSTIPGPKIEGDEPMNGVSEANGDI